MKKQENSNQSIKLLLLTAFVVGTTSCGYIRSAVSPSPSASLPPHSASSRSRSADSSPQSADSPPQSAMPSSQSPASSPTIVGKWTFRDGNKEFYEFKKDGTFVQKQDDEIYTGTYSLEGDKKIKMNYPDAFDGAEFEIMAVDDDTDRMNLTWNNGDQTILFRNRNGDYKESESQNQNNGGGQSSVIVGKWSARDGSKAFLEFKKDGGFVQNEGKQGIFTGTYSLESDKKIKLNYPNGSEYADIEITAEDSDTDRMKWTWNNGVEAVWFRSKSGGKSSASAGGR